MGLAFMILRFIVEMAYWFANRHHAAGAFDLNQHPQDGLNPGQIAVAAGILTSLGHGGKKAITTEVTPEGETMRFRGDKMSADRSGVKRRFDAPGDNPAPQKRLRFGDDDDGPLSNSRSSGKMPAAQGHDEEVAVVPAPRRISKIAPDYFTLKLPYTDTFRASVPFNGNACAIINTFRLNSIFDPDLTGTGHQPMGRDTWGGIYDYYRVLACDVKMNFVNESATTTNANDKQKTMMVGYQFLEDTGTAFISSRLFVESKHTGHQYIIGGERGGGTASFSLHFDPNQWDYHVTEGGDEERWTGIGANPTVNKYLSIYAGSTKAISGAATPTDDGNVLCIVELEYTVQFREANSTTLQTQS